MRNITHSTRKCKHTWPIFPWPIPSNKVTAQRSEHFIKSVRLCDAISYYGSCYKFVQGMACRLLWAERLASWTNVYLFLLDFHKQISLNINLRWNCFHWKTMPLKLSSAKMAAMLFIPQFVSFAWHEEQSQPSLRHRWSVNQKDRMNAFLWLCFNCLATTCNSNYKGRYECFHFMSFLCSGF